jgi:septum formation protein
MIWLASGSPRRRDLLMWAGYAVEVRPADVDESRILDEHAVDYARRLATVKASAAPDGRIVLAADTIVHIDDDLLGKPADDDGARAHLHTLSGRWHDVTTAVCVRSRVGTEVLSVTSEVRFRNLTAGEIEAYVQSGEGVDKAGAYGIQGRGGSLVGEVRGSWTNVMGLPMEAVLAALDRAGATR